MSWFVQRTNRILIGLLLVSLSGCFSENPPAVREPTAALFNVVLSEEDATILQVERNGERVDFADDPREAEILELIRQVVMPMSKLGRVNELPNDSLARISFRTGKDPFSIEVISIENSRVRFFSEFVVFEGGSSEAFQALMEQTKAQPKPIKEEIKWVRPL